jgi:hypothetical protein
MAKVLTTRLRAARTLLRTWQAALRDSHKCREPGPDFGKVTDVAMVAELAQFDDARGALTEAIKLLKERG